MPFSINNQPGPFNVFAELRAFLDNPACQDPETNATWYLFARIAQDTPSLLRECEKLFQKEPDSRSVLLRILAQAGDDASKTFLESCVADAKYLHARKSIEAILQNWSPGAISPLTKPVATGGDLDMLWCEFHATENTEPVRQIIDVLERPDHLRGKLEAWLHATANAHARRGFAMFAAVFRRFMIRRLWKQASILCDGDRQEVLSPQDLDCHIMMTGWDVDRERAVRIAKLLPFSLHGEDAYLSLKAVARWSLASHAHTHPIIFNLCESEAAIRKGRCRTLLLEIVAKESVEEDQEKAFGALQDSLISDPTKELTFSAKAAAEWERLSILSLDSASTSTAAPLDARQAALRCLRATATADTYRTRRLWVMNADSGVPYAIHEAQFAQPSNFRVFQTLWEQTGEVYDEWITAKDVHFRAPVWINYSERANRAVNSTLTAASYFGILKSYKPAEFGVHSFEGSPYFCFAYRNVPGRRPVPLWARFIFYGIRCDALLWADFETGRLAKVVLKFKPSRITGGQREEITHLFTCYDEPISITPPAFSLLGPAL